MIHALIIDDETNSRELLIHLIKKNCADDVVVVASAENVDIAEAAIREHLPNLLFLDIEIAGQTGFDLLEKIQDLQLDVIFTTAFDHYALKAIKFSAIDYLLKPIDSDELKLAVDKIKQRKKHKPTLDQLQLLIQNFKQPDSFSAKISLPTFRGFEIIMLKDIVRLESDGHYVSFHITDKKTILVAATLKNYEDILPANFFRIHNSHIVNMNYVVRIASKDNHVTMNDGTELELSRRKKEAFMQQLGLI